MNTLYQKRQNVAVLLAVTGGLSLPCIALAADKPAAVAVGIDPFYLVKTVGALCVVLIVIFIIARLVRALGHAGAVSSGPLKVLAAVTVGNREKLMIVQAGDNQLLIGISPSGIVRLDKFDEPVVTAQDIAQGSFKTQLTSLIGEKRQ
ncbi:MAG: flagellar biosynthetic protein FliO [Pseudomonadota bacterium]